MLFRRAVSALSAPVRRNFTTTPVKRSSDPLIGHVNQEAMPGLVNIPFLSNMSTKEIEERVVLIGCRWIPAICLFDVHISCLILPNVHHNLMMLLKFRTSHFRFKTDTNSPLVWSFSSAALSQHHSLSLDTNWKRRAHRYSTWIYL